jgi:hypothetical protein
MLELTNFRSNAASSPSSSSITQLLDILDTSNSGDAASILRLADRGLCQNQSGHAFPALVCLTTGHEQLSVAVPLTAAALLPLLMLSGAVAVMVMLPELRHVATPLEAMVATVGLELPQTNPLFELRERVLLLLIVPIAENETVL